MKKIDRVIKKLSDLYEFNRKIKTYALRKKERANAINPTPGSVGTNCQTRVGPGYFVVRQEIKA